MKDTELRGVVLQKYYENRRGEMFCPKSTDFDGSLSERDIAAISAQLGEHGLIKWRAIKGLGGVQAGMGSISAIGIDVVEGARTPDIKVEFVQSKTVNISGSSNIIVGDHNTQTVNHHIAEISRLIDSSSAPPSERDEAKGLLRRLAEHPLVAAIAGGAVSLLGG